MNVDSGPDANDEFSRFSLCFGLFHELKSQAPIHRSTPYSIVSAHSRVKEDSDRYQSGSYIDLPIFRVGCYVLPFWLRVCNICRPDLKHTWDKNTWCNEKMVSCHMEQSEDSHAVLNLGALVPFIPTCYWNKRRSQPARCIPWFPVVFPVPSFFCVALVPRPNALVTVTCEPLQLHLERKWQHRFTRTHTDRW